MKIKNFIFLHGESLVSEKMVAIPQNILLNYQNIPRQLLNQSPYWSFGRIKGCPFLETCCYLVENTNVESLSEEEISMLGKVLVESSETIVKCRMSGNMACKSFKTESELYPYAIPFDSNVQYFFKKYQTIFQSICHEQISPTDLFYFYIRPVNHTHHNHVPNISILTFTSDTIDGIQDIINHHIQIQYNLSVVSCNYFLVDLIASESCIFWFFQL